MDHGVSRRVSPYILVCWQSFTILYTPAGACIETSNVECRASQPILLDGAALRR